MQFVFRSVFVCEIFDDEPIEVFSKFIILISHHMFHSQWKSFIFQYKGRSDFLQQQKSQVITQWVCFSDLKIFLTFFSSSFSFGSIFHFKDYKFILKWTCFLVFPCRIIHLNEDLDCVDGSIYFKDVLQPYFCSRMIISIISRANQFLFVWSWKIFV